jgi:predicted dehydrogenase
MVSEFSRRRFLQTTGAALATGPLILSRAHGSPNETVNHAVIGIGGRGLGHCRRFNEIENCKVVAVSDLDPSRIDKAVESLGDASVKKYPDFRKLLEDKDIDSVSVATADHWHVPVALHAILAGKHVYLEKPASHNIHEANLVVKCAKEHKKCVQHGTQRRSSAEDMAGVRALKEGVIGDVYMAKAINHQRRDKIGKAKEEPPPPGVDYDLWLGAAPKVPFTKNRWHYNWHWFWDYGGGDLANDGSHQVDEAVWGMGLDLQYPDAVITSGAQLWYDDDHETPDTHTVIYEYPGKQIIFEMRLWTPYKIEGHDNGCVFYGTKGKMDIGREGAIATVDDKVIDVKPADYGIEAEEIMPNFITAVRHDDPSMLNNPIELGAVTTNLCHLGNIGYRCGNIKLTYDPKTETITKASENLDKANSLIKREYRKGYELPYTG